MGRRAALQPAEPRPGGRPRRRARAQHLRGGGLSDAEAVAAFSGVIALNYGWASFTTARDPARGLGAALASLPADAFPLTVQTAAEMGADGSDAHYDFALDQFLGGLRRAPL